MSDPGIASLGAFGRLPPELRIMVYDEIFSPAKVITPMRCFKTALAGDQLLQPDVYVKGPVQTSILATNKMIYKEALYVLYRDRIVRGSIAQLRALVRSATFRDLVRRIEIDDHFSAFQNHPLAHMLLLALRSLPWILSITILSDKFAFTQHNGRSYVTVREFATVMHMGEATCVDIGRFQLGGRFSHVQIVHRKLVNMWPDVASTPDDYDVYTDVLGLPSVDRESVFSMFNLIVWAAHTSLRRWVGLFDEMLRANRGLDHFFLMGKTEVQRALLLRFMLSTRGLQHLQPGSAIPSYAEYVYQSRVRNRLMNTLRPSDDPEILAWATDVLSVNIAAFYPLRGIQRQAFLRHAHWAEAEGGMHTLDIMKMHMLSALRGEVDAIYLSHPVSPRSLEYTATIRSSLAGWPQRICYCETPDLIPQLIRQLYLLQVAMNFWTHPQVQQQAVNGWSLQLFQRYLLADPSVRVEEANLAKLEDMRTVMGTILGSFVSPEDNFHKKAERLRRKKKPVGGLDPDLVPALA